MIPCTTESCVQIPRQHVSQVALLAKAGYCFAGALLTQLTESEDERSDNSKAWIPLRRVYSLRWLVECAFANLGRIRLVSGRLWAVVSPHLVSAACGRDPAVAALAVDSLRQLAAKLLARAELSNFTHQAQLYALGCLSVSAHTHNGVCFSLADVI